MVKETLKHNEVTEKIIGVFFDVYNELGEGFLESVHHNAMCIALRQAGLRAEREVALPVFFREQIVGDFRADLIVNGVVIVELKTVRTLEHSHEAQLFHYLRSTEIEVGLLLNFALAHNSSVWHLIMREKSWRSQHRHQVNDSRKFSNQFLVLFSSFFYPSLIRVKGLSLVSAAKGFA
jgi:GxxExxY protein